MSFKFNIFTGNFDEAGSGGTQYMKPPVATEALLSTSGNSDGDARVTLDTDFVWVWDSTTSRWKNTGVKAANVGSTPNAQAYTFELVNVGANRTEIQLQLQPANATNPGVLTAGTQTIGGDKTFQDDVVVSGDLTVNGTTTTINTTNLEVTDKNITVNNGGNDVSAEGAGLTVERTGTNGSFVYEDALASKFKAGALGSEIELTNVSSAQALTNKTINADLNTITNIENADIKANAAIDATKIADGSVTSTEFQYINTLTSNAQTQLNARIVGPASSTDNAIARYDGTTGKLTQDSLVTIDDAGVVSGATQLNVDNLRFDANTISSTNTSGNINLVANTSSGGPGGVVLNNLATVDPGAAPFYPNQSGQVFTTSTAGLLSTLEVHMNNTAAVWHYAKIYNTSGGLPTGSPIASSSAVLTNTAGNELVVFTFPGAELLPIGTYAWIVCAVTDNTATIEQNMTATNRLRLSTSDSVVGAGVYDSNNTIGVQTWTALGNDRVARLTLTAQPASQGNIVLDGSVIDASTSKIINVTDPTAAQDAATKNYVDLADANFANKTLSNLTNTIAIPNGIHILPANTLQVNLGSSTKKFGEVKTKYFDSILTSGLSSGFWGADIPAIVIDGDTTESAASFGSGILFKKTTNSGDYFIIGTQDNNAVGQTAGIFFSSGNNTVGSSGGLELFTGSVGAGNSGSVYLQSGISSSGNTGNHFYSTGGVNTGSGNTGAITLSTGNHNDLGNTGSIQVNTGTAAGGVSGNIWLDIGSGTTQGTFRFLKSGVSNNVGDVFTAINTSGEGYWAPLPATGANTTLSNLTSPTDINQNLTFDNTSDRSVIIEDSPAATGGRLLTVQAGGGNGTNQTGGNLVLSSGKSTGNQGSQILFNLAPNNGTSGASIVTPSTTFRMSYSNLESVFEIQKPFGSSNTPVTLTHSGSAFRLRGNLINSASVSTSMFFQSGDNSGNGGTGTSNVGSGASFGTGASGSVQINSGQSLAGGNSGLASIFSGNATNTSGAVSAFTGTGNISGPLSLTTGNATTTSGNISLTIGTGSTQGNIKLLKSGVPSVIGQVWTATSTDGSGYWATASSGANTALSNLITTSINQDLIPSTALGISLGSAAKPVSRVRTQTLEVYSGANTQVGFITASGAVTPSGTNLDYGITNIVNGSHIGLYTLINVNADAVATGNVYIETGDKILGTGNSGDINMKTGESAGGNRGNIVLNGRQLNLSSQSKVYLESNADVTISSETTELYPFSSNSPELKFWDGAGGFYAGIKSPALLSASYSLTLPVDDGAAGEVLSTNGTGVLSWVAAGGGGATTALDNLAAVAINTDLVFDTAVSGLIKTVDGVTTSESMSVKSGDGGSSFSGAVFLQSGDAPSQVSGDASVTTGSGSLGSGNILLYSGQASAGPSGNVIINSGDGTTGTGNVTITTAGPSVSGPSGNVSISTGSAIVTNEGSGALTIATGTALGTANSGIVSVKSGDAESFSGSVAIGSGEATVGAATSGTVDITTGGGNDTGGSSGDINVTTGGGDAVSGNINLTTGASVGTRGSISLNGLEVNVNSTNIVNVLDPVNAQDAATRNYVDTLNNNKKEQFTLSAGNITNGYVDLLNVAKTDSIDFVFGGLVSTEGTDYTVSYTGGAGGKTRITFSGHTPTLVATDVINIKYQF